MIKIVKLAEATAQATDNITQFNYTLPNNVKKCVLKVFSNHYNFVRKEYLHLTANNKTEVITYKMPLYSSNEVGTILNGDINSINPTHFQFARFSKLEIFPEAGKVIKGIIEQEGHGSPQPNRKVQVILEIHD